MKILIGIIFCTVIATTNADIITRKNKELNKDGTRVLGHLREFIREIMRNGYPDIGIPVLDPYALNFAHFELPGKIISLTANISDGTFKGLSDFQILTFNFNQDELSLDFGVSFPSLVFSAEFYKMHGHIMGSFPLAGEGILHLEVYELNLSGKIFLKQSESLKSILIDRFENPQFSVAGVESKTEFDGNFDDIFNAMIKDILPDYLNRFNRYIAATYSEPIINAINMLLGKFESW